MDYIFTYKDELYAVHHGAVYFWHGTKESGHVSNIPIAHNSKRGLKAYGDMSKPLSTSQLECFADAIAEYNQRIGALDAGIPLSVIEGKTKLLDHFSKDYINWKCNRKTEEES